VEIYRSIIYMAVIYMLAIYMPRIYMLAIYMLRMWLKNVISLYIRFFFGQTTLAKIYVWQTFFFGQLFFGPKCMQPQWHTLMCGKPV
jgi:hypothetical protein